MNRFINKKNLGTHLRKIKERKEGEKMKFSS